LLRLVFAWFAAAAFAVSLGFFLYAYLLLFGAPAPASWSAAPAGLPSARWSGMIAPSIFNVLLFTVFALHHSVFARTRIKQFVGARVRPDLERAVYTLVASVLFLLVCWLWLPVPGRAWRLDGVWRWLGYGVQAAGLAITIAGARALDVLDLAGVRQVTQTSSAHAALETGGVYGLVRHPVYFGWTLLVFGAPDMTYTRLVFAVVSTLYLVMAIPFEERSLAETFGPDYTAYRRKVRWRIFPGVH
jgi:protein-S-isoprenylcysteine O-methyltransferase Ste14